MLENHGSGDNEEMKGMYVSKITNWELVSPRVNKSQRPDGLRARDLKANASEWVHVSSFSKVLDLGLIPVVWRAANESPTS